MVSSLLLSNDDDDDDDKCGVSLEAVQLQFVRAEIKSAADK